MKVQILEFDAQDDRASVRDRLAWSQAPRVVLVFPNRGRTRLARLDLVLLHRQAVHHGRALALVTRHPVLVAAAEAAAIPCFASVDHVPETEWPTPHPSSSGTHLPAPPPRSSGLPPRPTRAGAHSGRGIQRWFWLAIVAMSLVALAAAVVPSADILVTPPHKPQQAAVRLITSSAAVPDPPSDRLPTRQVETELADSLRQPATGSMQAPEKPASGEALFTNLSGDSATIPEDTSVRSSNQAQQRYVTTVVAQLPAGKGSTVSVPITAVEPGAAGNLSAGSLDSIDGALGLLASVSNPQALTGGSDRSQAAVIEADLRAAQRALEDRLLAEAEVLLQEQLQEGERLLPGSLRIVSVLSQEFDHAPGDLASSVGLSQEIRASGLVAQEADLIQATWSSILATAEPGWEPARSSLTIVDVMPGEAASDEQVMVEARWTVVRPLDRVRLAQAITGQTTTEAAAELQVLARLAESPQIRLHPDWLDRLPWIGSRIRIATPWDGP
jgi:hypothetical protein